MKFDSPKLLAVDPSFTSSGWAVFSLQDNQPKAVGTICSKKIANQSDEFRLGKLQNEIEELYCHYELRKGDYLVLEGPAHLVLNPHTSLKVERVRGIFETLARKYSVEVPARINPRSMQREILGLSGKQLPRETVKEIAKQTALQLFGSELKKIIPQKQESYSQDILDALLIGSYASSRLSTALRTHTPPSLSFQTKKRRSNSPWRKSNRAK